MIREDVFEVVKIEEEKEVKSQLLVRKKRIHKDVKKDKKMIAFYMALVYDSKVHENGCYMRGRTKFVNHCIRQNKRRVSYE